MNIYIYGIGILLEYIIYMHEYLSWYTAYFPPPSLLVHIVRTHELLCYIVVYVCIHIQCGGYIHIEYCSSHDDDGDVYMRKFLKGEMCVYSVLVCLLLEYLFLCGNGVGGGW